MIKLAIILFVAGVMSVAIPHDQKQKELNKVKNPPVTNEVAPVNAESVLSKWTKLEDTEEFITYEIRVDNLNDASTISFRFYWEAMKLIQVMKNETRTVTLYCRTNFIDTTTYNGIAIISTIRPDQWSTDLQPILGAEDLIKIDYKYLVRRTEQYRNKNLVFTNYR